MICDLRRVEELPRCPDDLSEETEIGLSFFARGSAPYPRMESEGSGGDDYL